MTRPPALLRALVRLYPPPFRDRFGPDITETVAHGWQTARSRSAPAACWFFVSTAIDLVRSAAAERLRPTWSAPYHPPRPTPGMRHILDEWTRDLRVAVRSLRRSPGFAMVTTATLALAIGANAGIFAVVDTVLLNPLPYANADRLVFIGATAPGSDLPPEFGVSSEFYVHYRERSKLLEDVATYNSFTSTLRTPERVERVRMSMPSNSLFGTLGARPVLGRLPVDADEGNVVVISHALWQSWFGGDSGIVGKTFDIASQSRTIVGVMAPEFRFPDDGTMLWISMAIRPEGITPGRFGAGLVGRVREGTTHDALARELTALSRELPGRFGGTPSYARVIEQHQAVVRSLKAEMLGPASGALWILFGAVGIVLVVACANVANLFLVRAEGRQREIAVRRAIGAARGHLIRLQLAEALLLAVIAAALAAVMAGASLPALLRAAPPGVFRLADATMSGRVLGFAILLAFGAALACGSYPALRTSLPDLARLREGGRGVTRGRRWGRDALVVAQTALALVLLIGSGLLVRSFQQLRNVDPGYRTDDVFTFQIAPEGPSLPDGEAYARFSMRFMERLRALPSVEAVGLVENVPLNEGTASTAFVTEGGTSEEGVRLGLTFAAGDYFKVMEIAVRAGRSFPATDLDATRGTAVISATAARRLWPGEDAVGRRLKGRGSDAWHTVVGVVEDVRQDDFRVEGEGTVYYPLVGPTPTSWVLSSPAYVVRTPRAEVIAPEVRALAHEMAPEAPMYRVYTMDALAASSMIPLTFTMMTLGVVALLALTLGTVGLYGVLSYVVAERTREIGVRMALGARAGQVLRMVVVQGVRVVGVGVAIGTLVALACTRFLASLLFGVAPLDWITFVAMAAAMVAVGVLASYLPARRASAVAPMESLRGD
jgi:predicted permease